MFNILESAYVTPRYNDTCSCKMHTSRRRTNRRTRKHSKQPWRRNDG